MTRVSFEFFPPKSDAMEETLWATIKKLEPLEPDFVSVTYGAGGSTRERTHRTVKRIADETNLKAAAHLTCVAASKEEVNAVIHDYWDAGVRHIVALRGDMPEGPGTPYQAHADGYANGAELTAGIKAIAPFEVSVGCYPECHPDSADWEADIDMLEQKVDAGADRAITQFFFDNALFDAYRERIAKRGIEVNLVPGIMAVHSFKQVKRFADMCGASVPDRLASRFEGLEDDAEQRMLVSAAIAAEQVLDLQARGVDTFHFYTMNRAELVYALCRLIGINPATQPAAAA
ncbi:methylenetetrahydrofolate reductase [NAD(P)H] [Acuticoccus sp. I52.16.1]|uniref:methylenetetrahydrofolate reductase [NAD(P)H] n=1 Tax=Acuticoccus sp. I52.16.1 TaxID=2928472 RepID=UPI001FD0BE3E|nr:methylenetetrahydrofolate reductase [NAD(P)H] [Acuticoccus sp. I52.16.1]UOM36318.1 methylenetetrahydrofolate reductase [NAD(P)H] [Acuticoccus sp. I52.16.1]